MQERLDAMREEALSGLATATDEDAVAALLSRFVGRKGALQEILRGIGKLDPKERGPVGKGANEVKVAIQEAADARVEALRIEREGALADSEWVDPTLPPPPLPEARRTGGTIHPITQMIRRMEDVFLGMGFDLFSGPWVEDEHHNFDALNIPGDHPARDMHDTFWLKDGNLLRTHTSPVQIRAMQAGEPPLRGVAIGRVFRHEELDATHESNFFQCEGLYVDRDVSAGHMRYVLREMLTALFGDAAKIRFRPSYFPFTEPSFEVDVWFRGGWMELLGCGMVHPRVLEAGGIDPAHWSGFAFGVGVDRLVMLEHGIEDIRHLQGSDLRFLAQFDGGVEG